MTLISSVAPASTRPMVPATRAARPVRRSALGVCLSLGLALSMACGSFAAGRSSARGPDFPIVAYQGDEILGGAESSFARVFEHGKPVVLNFWAGQCPPCRGEMPAFQRVADAYEGRVIFVGVDVGIFTGLGSHDDARRLLQELGIRYPAAYAADATALRLYNVRNMPTTVLLRPDGSVAEQVGGFMFEDQLRRSIEKLLTS